MSVLSTIKATQASLGRTPPNSIEAEEYLLSCCLLDGADTIAKCIDAKLSPEAFYSAPNRVVYERILALNARRLIITLDILAEDLKAKNQLSEIGGYAYLMQISSAIPTTAQIEFFIETLCDCHARRELIKLATGAVENCYAGGTKAEEVLTGLRTQIDSVGGGSKGVKPRSIASFEVPIDNDASVLLGNRYLNRGDGALVVSTSGMGKSSLTIQAAVTWALGKPFFGIQSNGPLRSLIVQAEDSDGDVAEVWWSVSTSLNLTPDEVKIASSNVLMVTERVRRGAAFIAALRRWILDFKPDLVWINPLLAFLDGDVNEAKDTGKFLREGLNGLNEPANFAYMVVHHTTKPPTGKDKKNGRAWNEVMYDMAGSADLTNWARAIMSLRPAPTEGAFELVLAKRGRRAGVTREVEQGLGKRLETITTIPLKHAEGTIPVPGRKRPMPRIFWEYRDTERDEAQPTQPKRGRPKEHTFAEFVTVFPTDPAKGLGFRAIHRAANEVKPVSKSSFSELMEEALSLRLIGRNDSDPSQPRYYRILYTSAT